MRLPSPTPESVFALLRDRVGAAWLDGGDDEDGSVLVWDPEDSTTDPTAWPEAGRRLTGGASGDVALPFVAGCVGYVGYGAGHVVAPVPAGPPTWEPDVWLGHYPGALVYHRPSATWTTTGTAARQAEGRALLDAAVPLDPPPPASVRPTRSVSRTAYEAAVRQVQAWIAEGDHYQLNLTRAVWVDGAGDPWEAWRRLRHGSRPGRGAYLVVAPGVRVLSNSPERLLDVQGEVAVTEPIKGTRPRHPDPAVDAAHADALRDSPKERAELTMIVDLCRNDLGRVARPGTVTVGPRTLTPHANVHHASQVVQARLRPDADAWSALAALFPPGSVVGAPKVRAASRIATLEPDGRGVYCGAIGYASGHGRAAWSVAIRTAVFRDGDARFGVGGGIVADSVPADEWAETVDKGRVLTRALAGHDPTP
ncbi:MAG: anthranilate synthase component I family protein [Alphaproteobacteria bacterium]|nr:anthranilate synthase component I family protein [Alphaproteobacteria bacterium]